MYSESNLCDTELPLTQGPITIYIQVTTHLLMLPSFCLTEFVGR